MRLFSFVSDYYKIESWSDTYRTALPIILTHDLSSADGIQPPGEKIERGRKKKARAEAGKRATQSEDLIDYSGLGSQRYRKDDFRPTGGGHGYKPKGTQTCKNCGQAGHNKLSCPTGSRLRTWNELSSADPGQSFRPAQTNSNQD